jgi:hypothetical protein
MKNCSELCPKKGNVQTNAEDADELIWNEQHCKRKGEK